MGLRITTLIENTKGEHLALKSEHGISFFIEKDGHKLLFDTGQSGTFLENAEQLQTDLSNLEYVVISHGHYDHSGGFRALTGIAKKFELIVGDGFFNNKYGYRNNSYEFLGNNFKEDFLKENKISYRLVNKDITEILPGIYVITNFSRVHNDEVINPRFKLLKDGVYKDDPFNDEVLVAVDTPEGLVVLLGCSHPGMKNMLDAAGNLPGKSIYAVLGGTHLIEASDNSMDISMDYLNNSEMKVIGISHCTGQKAISNLSISNDRYCHNRTGSSLIIE
ncbi:MAG: MBL fold metallo-hydrolase [Spirochaetales bacterium]|nr:MBL fold metallo-hydrolase [Spirochaetales bacterium]